ncbi:mechanosensitive ion channel domain-containing protein [Sedimentitalea sp. HM32M-2]|uniref:mechanosensitive ion channel domain-containing protein n=1 Tax=Sedimentitalea sp. HM32M-2 TaxID=3351566 RepID=UPI00362AAFA0
MRVLLVCLICLLPGLATAQTTQPTGTIEVQDSAAQDAAIAVRIRDILSELEAYDGVSVTVTSGIVTLRGHTVDRDAAQRLNDLISRVEGVVAIENQVTETTDVVERLNPAIDRFRARIAQSVAYLPLLSIAVLAFGGVVLLGTFLARLRQPWDRLAPNAFIADIYRQIVRLVFVVAGIVVGLDILGASALLSTILGAAGIVGLAIGFAVRDTVENFIASILLSIRQPFRPNDTIEIGGDTGKVIRLTSRATILLSFDGNHIRIPNATVFKSRIVNFTLNDERRFQFDLAVAPDTDLAQARRVALETLNALPFVLPDPAVSAWVDSIGDSTVSLKMTGWIAQHETSITLARSEAIRLTILAFDRAGIAMPEPSIRVSGMLPERAAETRPHVAATPIPPSRPVAAAQDVTATENQDLDRIIAEERAEQPQDDLLNREAPRE